MVNSQGNSPNCTSPRPTTTGMSRAATRTGMRQRVTASTMAAAPKKRSRMVGKTPASGTTNRVATMAEPPRVLEAMAASTARRETGSDFKTSIRRGPPTWLARLVAHQTPRAAAPVGIRTGP